MKLRFFPLLLLLMAVPCFGATITIKTADLPNGIVHNAYSGVLTVSGACTPYAWKLTSGSLPKGITMTTSTNTKTLTFSGTPTKAATYSFTVSATGCSGSAAKASCKIIAQSSSSHVVDLSWQPSTSTDVVGYNVYRGPDGKTWSKINTSLAASTAFGDSEVANSSTYYYAATAVDTEGEESKKSNIVKSAIP